jgi:hypothetical protein
MENRPSRANAERRWQVTYKPEISGAWSQEWSRANGLPTNGSEWRRSSKNPLAIILSSTRTVTRTIQRTRASFATRCDGKNIKLTMYDLTASRYDDNRASGTCQGSSVFRYPAQSMKGKAVRGGRSVSLIAHQPNCEQRGSQKLALLLLSRSSYRDFSIDDNKTSH